MFHDFLVMFREEEAQGLVEYALIIMLVALVVIGILTTMSGSVGNVLTRISDALLAGS
ncbi:MAG TPA: Flp family type IVb pilin [Syntrophales bacterium]|nr:Flp family type IVb pilin [Syntrophales bacterium]